MPTRQHFDYRTGGGGQAVGIIDFSDLSVEQEQVKAAEGWSHSSAKKVGKDRNKLVSH